MKTADDYNLVEGNCPDGTSTDPISPPPPETNAAPRFTTPATKSVPENTTSVPTVTAVDDDSQDSVTGYDIVGGADQGQFSIVRSTGDLTFKTAPDYENEQDANGDNVYEVVVEVTSGTGDRKRDTKKTITITVIDVDEPPGRPNAPTVSAESVTSLMVRWSAPTNSGPPINDYDYRYRTDSPEENWTEVTNTTINALEVTISNLDENTAYDVQILAKNPEGESGWSTEGTGSTGATDPNADPRFTSLSTASVLENTPAVLPVTAVDDDTEDNIEDYEIVGGADWELFSIVSSTGVLTFKTAPNYEAPQDVGSNNQYVVVVRATSGTESRERTTDQTIIVTVTNVQEPGDPVNSSGHHGHHAIGNRRRLAIGNTSRPAARGRDTCRLRGRAMRRQRTTRRVTFIVQLSTTASQDAVVEYATSSGTARAGQDYEATSGTLTIPAGDDEAGDPRAHH